MNQETTIACHIGRASRPHIAHLGIRLIVVMINVYLFPFIFVYLVHWHARVFIFPLARREIIYVPPLRFIIIFRVKHLRKIFYYYILCT